MEIIKLVCPALLINGEIRLCGEGRGHYSEMRHFVAEKFLRPFQWEECDKHKAGQKYLNENSRAFWENHKIIHGFMATNGEFYDCREAAQFVPGDYYKLDSDIFAELKAEGML